ncbi:MAG: hypothetical protein ACPG21_14015 [Crocinitomicaceae bacterium]
MNFKLFVILFLVFSANSAYCEDFESLLRRIFESDSLSDYKKQDRIPAIILEGGVQEVKYQRFEIAQRVIAEYDVPNYYWKLQITANLLRNELQDYAECSEHAYQLLEVAKNNKEHSWQADVYFLLYDIHLKLNMPELAKQNLKDALDCAILGKMQSIVQRQIIFWGTYSTPKERMIRPPIT